MKKHYERRLLWALEHKRTVLGGTIALFIVALGAFFTLGHSFLPPFNEGSFTINVSSLPVSHWKSLIRLVVRQRNCCLPFPK